MNDGLPSFPPRAPLQEPDRVALTRDEHLDNPGAGQAVRGCGPIRSAMLDVGACDADDGSPSDAGGPDGLPPAVAGAGHPKTGERGPQHGGGMPGRLYAEPPQTPPDPATGMPRPGLGSVAAGRIALDTTPKSRGPDRARFGFGLPAGPRPVKVQAKPVHSSAFDGSADAKGWKVADRPMRGALREARRD
jgi:hypothetical protein